MHIIKCMYICRLLAFEFVIHIIYTIAKGKYTAESMSKKYINKK